MPDIAFARGENIMILIEIRQIEIYLKRWYLHGIDNRDAWSQDIVE